MAALFPLGIFRPQYADNKAAKIISGDEIALADGRIVRLAGVKSFLQVQDFLQAYVTGLIWFCEMR